MKNFESPELKISLLSLNDTVTGSREDELPLDGIEDITNTFRITGV